jgi:hypothetical protein
MLECANIDNWNNAHRRLTMVDTCQLTSHRYEQPLWEFVLTSF